MQYAGKFTPAGLKPVRTTATGLYDLWLNSMLTAVGTPMVTGVTSSSSHWIASQQIDSQRLAEKLLQHTAYNTRVEKKLKEDCKKFSK